MRRRRPSAAFSIWLAYFYFAGRCSFGWVDGAVRATRLGNKSPDALTGLNWEVNPWFLHYSPTRETVEGESPEIYPFLGSSMLKGSMKDALESILQHKA
jgi:hypothetical protein